MGQCQTCSKQLQYNAIDSDDLLSKLQRTDIGADILKLRADNREAITNFKFTPMPDKSFFKGNVKDTKRTGYGQNYSDCFNYFGFYHQDLPHGLGAIVTETQCLYGQFNAGMLQGKGKEWSQGLSFDGTYNKGERVEGRLSTDEMTYNGQFINGLYHGKGTLTLKNGTNYSGQFICGKFSGEGELVLQSGCRYKGGFVGGLYEGYGEFKWPNGNFFRGQYHGGKRDGYGVLKIGQIEYSGTWKKGVREGHGILTHQSEFGFGVWHNNLLVEE